MERTFAVSAAVLVPTPDLVDQMVCEKPACWTWAAFASVVFQRWAAVEERKVHQVLGTPADMFGQLLTARETAQFVAGQVREADDVVAEIGRFLRSPAFTEIFGANDDESTADSEAIIRAGHQLGDYYERLLELAEECRKYSVPEQYADLAADCIQFMNQPLQDFGGFVNDVLERLEVLQKRVLLGRPYFHLGPIALPTACDDRLVWSILDRLQSIE